MDLQTVTQMRKVVRTSGIARQAYQDALPTAFGSEAWQKYFTRPEYLSLVERKFGPQQRQNVEAMARIKLRRKLLGDPPPSS